MSIKAIAESMFDAVRTYVTSALDPLHERVVALESRQPERGEKGERGEPGVMGKEGAPGERGERGEPGPAGRNGLDAYEIAKSIGFQGNVYEWMESQRGPQGPAGPMGERGEKGERGERGEPGPAGRDGQSIVLDDVLPIIRDAVAAIPKPRDGEQGPAGKDGRDGVDGRDGADGRDGKDGERGPQGERGEKGDAGPAGRDGVDGKDGAPGRDGQEGPAGPVGERGEIGPQGEPGKSVTLEDVMPFLESLHAKWALEWERDANERIQAIQRDADERVAKAIASMPTPKDGAPGRDGKDGRDGIDGKDGADGLGFEDLSFDQPDDRTLVARFVRGELSKEVRLRIPGFSDCGVFRADARNYMRGDGVTYGGSFWIAQKDNPQGSPGSSADWRLAVKRGKDGK